ncbi:hypothetical protein [Methylotenera sp. G11]|uniref:hypothetical protein n=1 Tax=Methylotenera sp. G11 TaxID=1506585 RepID=UPI0006479541|nr:hypothetical protein [Methylotenera sp. G11]
MKQVKWWVFGVVATFLAWRIVAVNVSQHLAAENITAASAWNKNSSQILLAQAAVTAHADAARARAIAEDAVFYNPASGRGFLMLAGLLELEGNVALAQNAAKMAHFLAPRDADVQLPLGAFWLRRGLPIQALSHWGAAVESNPALSKTLFPVMQSIVDTPQSRLEAAKVLSNVPDWWNGFFMHVLKNTTQEDTLKALYLARSDKIAHDQRRAYIDHLLDVGYYTDAYFVWLNGLQSGQLAALGNVYDGGFEQMLDDEGFGWRLSVSKGVMMAAEPTYGQGGKKALHVAFQQKLQSRELIHQFLMLDAGKYRLSGKARLDKLDAGKGVRWEINCADRDGRQLLSSSEYFIGTDSWNKFETGFDVPPEKCEVQMLRLQLDAGNDYDETPFSGAAWFDDLEIARVD